MAEKTYLYGDKFKPTPATLKVRDRCSDSQLEDRFIKEILKRLDFYLTTFTPEDYFIVAVDGPVPLAKIAQQRIRRFGDGPPKPKPPGVPKSRFDSALISPGTEVMENIHKSLKKWFYQRASEDKLPRFASYSSFHEPGEGEHKMVQMLMNSNLYKDQHPDGMHMLCGQDSDLLMLGTLIPFKNVVHYREDREKEALSGNIEADMFMVDMWKDHISRNFLRDNIEVDFVLAYFTFGNDFMPKNPTLYRADETLKNISEAYIRNGKRLVHPKTGKINREYFLRFLSFFDKIEQANLDMQAATFNPKYQLPFPILTNNTRKLQNGRISVDIEGFKRDWYERALQTYNEMAFLICGGGPLCEKVRYSDIEVFKEDMIENYLQMLQWNLDYYLGRTVDWNFQYQFYFTPILSDVANSSPVGDILRRSDDIWKSQSSILRQIIMISHPAKIRDFIPKQYYRFLQDPAIQRVSPDGPIIFYDGKREEKDSHIFIRILPLVTHDYFEEVLKDFKGSLPERMQVSFDPPDVYIKDSDKIESEDNYLPGSNTRVLSAKKIVWTSSVVS